MALSFPRMCYSVLAKTHLKELQAEFHARVDIASFEELYQARLRYPEIKIPLALDRHFVLSGEAETGKLAALARQFHEQEKTLLRANLKNVETEIRELASAPPTSATQKKQKTCERKFTKLQEKLQLSFDRISPQDERVFPGTFAPAILVKDSQRRIVPMRYRVQRTDGSEIPSKYNVFNARRESLQSAETWRQLFGRTHAIFPFAKFFEWVERDEKKQELSFAPENLSLMWAASLYSKSKSPLSYFSFAMITDTPPPEVEAAGHDRCPIFLHREAIDAWLNPQRQSLDFLLSLLDKKENAFYLNTLAS